MNEKFELYELKEICQDMGVDDENFPSQRKLSFIRELLEWLENRDRLSELDEIVVKQRPGIYSDLDFDTGLSSQLTKILFLAANPSDSGRLRLDEEVREIEEALTRSQHRERFQLISKFAVRAKELGRSMLEENPQIVHFSGHGVLHKESSESASQGSRGFEFDGGIETNKYEEYSGGIVLEDDQGHSKVASASALSNLFGLFQDNIQCVFLNACYSDAQAEALLRHVPYVIGMNAAVPDKTAISFTTGFYDALGVGKDIESAFKYAKAMLDLETLGGNIPILRKKV